MTKETWINFRTDVYLRRLNIEDKARGPLIGWSHHTVVWWRAVQFIEKLLKSNVPLEQIDINDFESSWPCRVYVGNRSYTRFAPNDYRLALTYLKRSDKQHK